MATGMSLDVGRGLAYRGKYNPLTYMEKAMGATLRGFDLAAYERARMNTLGEAGMLAGMKKGLKGKALTAYARNYARNADENLLKLADDYGKYVTFQDINWVSQAAVTLKKGLNVGKDFGFGDLFLKYPLTPSNLIMRGLEYSPFGVARSAAIIAEPWLKKADPNPREATLAISRAAVGSIGFTALGAFLYQAGLMTGAPDDDWETQEFLREQTGERGWQVNLTGIGRWVLSGFKRSAAVKQEDDLLYSYDWALPMSLALAAGADLMKSMKEAEGEWSAFAGAGGAAIETIAQAPMVEGLTQLFRYPRWGEKLPVTVARNVARALEGIPAQVVPTFVNQIAQFKDNTARETSDPSALQRATNRLIARLPYVRERLPLAYKTLGVNMPQERFQNGTNTLFNVFFNPGFVARYEVDPLVRRALDLYETTGAIAQMPRRVGTRIGVAKTYLNDTLGTELTETTWFALTGEDRQILQRSMATYVAQQWKRLENERAFDGKTPDEQTAILVKVLTGGAKEMRGYFAKNMAAKYPEFTEAR